MRFFPLNIKAVLFLLFVLQTLSFATDAQKVDSQRIDSLLIRANVSLEIQKYEIGKKYYEKILDIDEANPQALIGLTRVAIGQKDWGKAKDLSNEVLKQNSDNLDAHYYRGIGYRETGKFKALLMRKLDWDKSEKHFNYVIQRDSLFKDVLYQYAKLLRYRGKFEKAIQMGQAQIRIHPELIEPQVRLFRIYRYYITDKDEEEAISWLGEQPWDHATYFMGEKLRRKGKFKKSASVFQKLLIGSPDMPIVPIYTSLARVYFSLNRPDSAEFFYWTAVDTIQNRIDAKLLFKDIKYIVSEKELKVFRALNSVAQLKDFFHDFWTLRNPIPAAPLNSRMEEHYRRMRIAEKHYEYDGFRTWFANPDKLNRLELPETNQLNQEFNDKGLIFIRHGAPDDRAVTLGGDVPFNESWLYYQKSSMPQLTFHFILGKSGNDWRFAPIIRHPALLEDRLTWGQIYHQLLTADFLEQSQYEQEMADQSKQSTKIALNTDRHSWSEEIIPLPMALSTTTFQGDSGQTQLELAYEIPLDSSMNHKDNPIQNIEIESGISIFDRDLTELANRREVTSISLQQTSSYLNLYRFTLPPSIYSVSIYARSDKMNRLGGFKFNRALQDYSVSDLKMSEILLARQIEPATDSTKFVKNGLSIVPNPTNIYGSGAPLYIYFEVYHLSPNGKGKSQFTIDYKLTSLEKDRSIKTLFGLLGGDKEPSVTIQNEREVEQTSSIEYLAIDVSNAEPGKYELSVKITDENNGNSIERSRRVLLKK